MSKLKSFHLMIILIIIVVMCPYIGQTNAKDGTDLKGSEVISINLPSESHGNEMPAVDFMHTLHNQAADNKCVTCHTQKDDSFVFKFKETDDPLSMEFYHDNCISCHIETKANGKKSGPHAAECRSCHGTNKKIDSSWTKIDFNKSLHFLHETSKSIKSTITSESDNCSACHHKYYGGPNRLDR